MKTTFIDWPALSMCTCAISTWVCVLLMPALLLCGAASAQGSDASSDLRPGQAMPFHVVDFVAGPRSSGCGCPSVMINNSRSRGLIIWAVSGGETTDALTRRLDHELRGLEAPIFLVVASGRTGKSYTLSPFVRELKTVQVAVPRSARTATLLMNSQPEGGNAVVAFFLNGKVIEARVDLPEKELSSSRIESFAEQAKSFLAGP